MLPGDFSLIHALAIVFLFASWFAYSLVLRLLGRGSLNAQLSVVRRDWLMESTRRSAKPFDAVILGHIIHSIAFFGSATMIVLAGIITVFASLSTVHATILELRFVDEKSFELVAIEAGILTLIVAISFFSFTYALRKLIYLIPLVGALPDSGEPNPAHVAMVDAAATVLSEAVKTFNFGIRGYYYFIAALCLIASPYMCLAVTFIVNFVLLYRQLATPTAHAIQAYVKAANSTKK